MNAKRRLIIGDIHGCIDELESLLKEFAFIPDSDSLISVGDTVGKGPHSLKVLELLYRFNALIARGNHDQAMLNYAVLKKQNLKPYQAEYLASLGSEAEKWLEYINSWPYFLEWDDLIVVHAGLEPGKVKLAQMDPVVLMNIRNWDSAGKISVDKDSRPWFEFFQQSKMVVFGHWAERGLVDLPLFKGLDTGCVYGKKLTGYCPEEDKFYQVKSNRVYLEIV